VKVAPGWIPAPALILYHQEQRADSERVSAALMPGHYYIWSFVAAHLYQMMEIYRFRQIYGQFGVVVEYLLCWRDFGQRPDAVNYEAASSFLAAVSSCDCWDI